MIDINWNPSKKELRQFAGLFLAIFGSIGAWLHFQSGIEPWGMVLGAVAGVVGVVGLAVPMAIKPLFVGWIVAAYPIGWTISHVLLALIYYVILTPIGLLLRAGGTDPMERTLDAEAKTYWTERDTDRSAASYFRQY